MAPDNPSIPPVLKVFLGSTIAAREGVDPAQRFRVAAPALIVPNLALGMILVDRLAKQEAAAEAASSTDGGSLPTGSASPTRAITAGPSNPGIVVGVHVARAPQPETCSPGDMLEVDAEPPANATFTWLKDSKLMEPTAAGPKYQIRESDRGHKLTVQMSYTDPETRWQVLATSPQINVAS